MTRRRWFVIYAAMILFSALFLIFYPPKIAGIEDEVGFINQTIVWSHGAVTAEDAGFGSSVDDFVPSAARHGEHVGWRNPGRSLIGVPFFSVGGQAALPLVGLIFHLLIAWLSALILDHFTRRPAWAVLVLLHPTLALYSRTVMGDEPAAAMLMFALYVAACTKRSGAWVGACVGLAALMRYHAGACLPFICIWLWCSDRRRRRTDAMFAALVGAIFALGIASYNVWVFGNPLGITTQGCFSLSFVLPNLVFYAVCLLALWPGMLFAPLLDTSRFRWLGLSVAIPTFATFVGYYFHDTSDSPIATLVVGQRLIQPMLAPLIVSFAIGLNRLASERLTARRFYGAITLITVVVTIGIGLIFRKHQARLRDFLQVRNDLLSVLPRDATVFANSVTQKTLGVLDERTQLLHLDGYPEATTTLMPPRSPFFIAFKPRNPGEHLPLLEDRFVGPYHMTTLVLPSGAVLYRSNVGN